MLIFGRCGGKLIECTRNIIFSSIADLALDITVW